MKKILSYITVLCLITIVVLLLIKNKRDINAAIEFAERKVETYPVKVITAKPGAVDTRLEVPGILSPADELMLMAETQGRVKTVFKKEGDWVRKGETIAKVDDELMRAELLVTQANYEKAQKDLERARVLSSGDAITQQQLEGLILNEKAAKAKYLVSKKRVEDTSIKAPFSGYINKLFIKEGGMIGPGVPVCELVNIRALKVKVKVDESEMEKISKGQKVDVVTENLNNQKLSGTVTSISSKADYSLQYEIGIDIHENPGDMLKAGVVVTVIFHFADTLPGVVIPRDALVGSIKDPAIFIVENETAVLRPVRLSVITEDQAKVTEGLTDGELVVTQGQFNLKDGTKVKITE